MNRIKTYNISELPASFICPRELEYANMVWVKMWNGEEYDLLFNENGNPLLDQKLIAKIEVHFNKRFKAMWINNELIYGQKISQQI